MFSICAETALNAYFLSTLAFPRTDTHVYIRTIKNSLIIAYRGTDRIKDWFFSVWMLWEKICPYANIDPQIKVHKGFLTGYLDSRYAILDFLRKNQYENYYFVGHSLGGAECLLAALDAQFNLGISPKVITFGSPLMGNQYFRDSYNERIPDTVRFVSPLDPVPLVPLKRWGYRHVGKEIKLPLEFFPYIHNMHDYFNQISRLESKLIRDYPGFNVGSYS